MACLPLLSWRARRSGNNPSQFVLREFEGSNRPSAADCGWITRHSDKARMALLLRDASIPQWKSARDPDARFADDTPGECVAVKPR
jgi:glutathione synthase/RimK-type ligase-like ATP-grasp enzyme